VVLSLSNTWDRPLNALANLCPSVFQVTNFGCLLLALWGMVGIWTTKFGYHNIWEFWLFNAQYGFTLGAQFSYGQAFMAELVPRGREYMFFSLLGIVSKGSSWIGPIVCSAIQDANGNQVSAHSALLIAVVRSQSRFFSSRNIANDWSE